MEIYQNLLKENNLSVTQARIEILRVLDEQKKPCTIDEVQQSLVISVNNSTLYRSLKTMVDKGIIYQTDFREGVAYFEYQGEHHHHHITCTSCKSQSSIDACVASMFPSLEKETSFTITNHIFELFGLCENCS